MKSRIQTHLVPWLVARLFSWMVFMQTSAETLVSDEPSSGRPKVLTMLDSWRKYKEKSMRLYIAAYMRLLGPDLYRIYLQQNQRAEERRNANDYRNTNDYRGVGGQGGRGGSSAGGVSASASSASISISTSVCNPNSCGTCSVK